MADNTYRKKLFHSAIIFFVVMVFCTIMLCGSSVYYQQRRLLVVEYGKTTNGVAKAVATFFEAPEDRVRLKKYIRTLQKDEKYDEMSKRITDFKETLNVTYIYVFTVKNEKEVYIFDAYTRMDVTYELGDIEELRYKLPVQMIREGKFIDNFEVTNSEKFGSLVTSYAPIYDQDGSLLAFVGVDYRMSDIFAQLNHFILMTLIQSSVLLIVFTFIAFFYVNRRMVQPIEQLARAMSQYASISNKEIKEKYLVWIKTGNEIEQLADTYNLLITRIDEYIAKLRESVQLRERTKGELNAALQIQRGILPQNLPPTPDYPNVLVSGSLNPAREVGGDLYDVFPFDRDRLTLIIGDVSGKGVPAALFMTITQTLQRSIADGCDRVDELANELNSFLASRNTTKLFVTWWAGILNIRNGELCYLCAGHNPPVLKRSDGSAQLLDERHGPPLGIIPNISYKTSSIMLNDGDSIVLYTDGITEASCQKEIFGTARLLECLEKMTAANPQEIVEKVKETLAEFTQGAEPSDDSTVLAFQYRADHS